MEYDESDVRVVEVLNMLQLSSIMNYVALALRYSIKTQ